MPNQTATDTVKITVISPFAPTVARAGDDRTVASGAPVTLDGNGSTSDRRFPIGAYKWERTGGTTGGSVTLSDANVDKPSFVADTLMIGDSDVTHIFTLTVTDNNGETATATVTITVTSGFAAPVAEAGPAQTGVASGTVVTLDGRGSTVDRRRTPLSYAWTRPSGTEGGTGGSVTLTGADTAQPTFMAETLTSGAEDVTYIFQLIVTDDEGAISAPATVTVTARAVDIRVSDSDLTVREGGTGAYQVRLNQSPGQEVVIMAVSGNEDVVQLNNARLVFNAGNWDKLQEVEINTVAGAGTENGTVRIRHRLVTAGATSAVPGDVIVTLLAREADPVPRPVGQFIETRATALINNQPGLSSFLELDGLNTVRRQWLYLPGDRWPPGTGWRVHS